MPPSRWRSSSLSPDLWSGLAGLTEQAKTLYGNVKIKSVKVVVDGDQVTATYTYPVPAINQTDEPWVLEDGTWHNGEC